MVKDEEVTNDEQLPETKKIQEESPFHWGKGTIEEPAKDGELF